MYQKPLERALAGLCPEVRFFPEIDSTNRIAVEWAGAGAPDWAIVVTDYQTAGRGRFDRKWFAPPGDCLMFSLVLRPACEREQAPLANLAAAVALSETIEEIGLLSRLKWPNDVLVGGGKVAGILSEAVPAGRAGAGDRPLTLVLGIGVNVNVREFPPELAASATSLLMQAGRPFARTGILRSFLEHLRTSMEAFPSGVVEAYSFRSSTLGKSIRVQVPAGILEGKAERIDRLGNLVLSTGEKVFSGDVSVLAGEPPPFRAVD